MLRSSRRFDDERVVVVNLMRRRRRRPLKVAVFVLSSSSSSASRRPTIPPPPSSLRRMAESRVAWRRRARRRREHICVMCDICDTRDIFSLVWDEMSVQFFPIWIKIARSLHYFLSLSLSLSCSRARVPKRVLSLLQKRLLKLPFLRAGTFCFAAASSKGPHHHLGES